MDKERASQVRVGFFVILIVTLFGISIFILGQERNLFKKQVELYAYFSDIAGLKPSSSVRLAGLTIGVVNAIELPKNVKDKRLKVQLKINSEVMDKIRQDSVATIDSQGLLGDKLINITIGSADVPGLKDEDTIKTSDPYDFNQAIEMGKEVLENIRKISKDLKVAVAAYSAPEFEKEVKTIIHSIADFSKNISDGPGMIHNLIYDKKMGQDAQEAVANLRELSVRLDATADKVLGIANEIATGKGTLHKIIYENAGKELLENVTKASADIASFVDTVKKDKGPLHQLIYAEGGRTFINDLEDTAKNLKEISDTIKKGEGTVGGLIEDPTLYEDMKSIFGTIKRNEMIKALVRYSISKGEEKTEQGKPVKEVK